MPPELAETLQACIRDPRLLDGLRPAEAALRRRQIKAYQSTREMRSAASKAGWVARREAEAVRLVDRLCDPDLDDAGTEAVWDSLSGRQQQIVTDWLATHRLPGEEA